MSKIRVLTVDDSALMRQVLAQLLSKDCDIEVIGSAPDPFIAREKIKALNPDVLTLDVEMPKMDGLTFLEKLMAGHPMPVVMVSSLTEAGCQTTLRALELGAVDFITKPKIDLREGMEEVAQDLIAKIKAAAVAKVGSRRPGTIGNGASGASSLASRLLPPVASAMIKTTDTIIAIGASTGGTEALRAVLEVLPPNTPPIIVTQHMPERFTKTLADRLNQLCRISVNTPIMPGVLIVEAMAQLSGLLFAQRLEHTGKLAVLLSMDDVKLRKAVVPGDQLILTAEAVKSHTRTAHCKCKATVNESVVAECELKFMLVDNDKL